MRTATTWPNHMIITKLQIVMTRKPYFAPTAEPLEMMPLDVLCGSQIDFNSMGGESVTSSGETINWQ